MSPKIGNRFWDKDRLKQEVGAWKRFHEKQTGIDLSVGVGDSYDNTMAESIIGLFRTEGVNFPGPWKSINQIESEGREDVP